MSNGASWVASWVTEAVEDKPSDWTHERKSRPFRGGNSNTTQLRETNKRLRAIYTEAGLNYGEDVDETQLCDRFNVALKLRKRNVKEVLKHIRQSRNVELCFMVDATGSMRTHIEGVRNSIVKIVDLLKAPAAISRRVNTANKLRISMVAYRDIRDEKRFEVLDFTESIQAFQDFCGKIVAEGGGDTPEDVFGAFGETFKLDWSENFGTKVIFHIADAPCHGRKYHNYDDWFPLGDPAGRTEETIFNQITDMGIDYYFGKINLCTDKMIDYFAKAYGQEITQFNVMDVLEITTAVFTAVSTSVFFSTRTRDPTHAGSKMKKYTLVKEIPIWDLLPKKEGRFLDYEMPESIEDIINDVPLKRNAPRRALIQLADAPFANGAERYAFYGKDVTRGGCWSESIVLKEYIFANSKKDIATRYEITNQIQSIAELFAKKYNQVFKDAIGFYYMIKFLKVKTLCLPMGEKEFRYLSCEKQYGKDDVFVRFTNNADYSILDSAAKKLEIKMEFVWALTSFSHWTYQVTNGKLMVVDLQGIIQQKTSSEGESAAVLTDPAIHCVDETRFGRMNLGKEGMEIFFKRHECNKFCEALNLKPFDLGVEPSAPIEDY